jgi:hypothetical protein
VQLGVAGDDGASSAEGPDAEISARLPQDKPILRVWNKVDLSGEPARASDGEVWARWAVT